nr:AmmeMemoRadiSam system protein A [Anaerolineae bacterium]
MDKQENTFSPELRHDMLDIARQSIRAAAAGKPMPSVDTEHINPLLLEPGACFVTLHRKDGSLRGCTGILVAELPLIEELIRTAGRTALRDPRFHPVQPDEVDDLIIEISVLTPPQPLVLARPEDLPRLIRPGIDGVTLSRGYHRATFLPQVWEKIPDPVRFLDMLCQKMGLEPGAWRYPTMQAEVYQVEEFSEMEERL